MRISIVITVSAASLGLAIALASEAASAKTAAECKLEYATNKIAMEARGCENEIARSQMIAGNGPVSAGADVMGEHTLFQLFFVRRCGTDKI